MQENKISYVNLSGGKEVVSLSALKITSIPHFKIVNPDDTNPERTLESFKSDINIMLNEFYQLYRTGVLSGSAYKDISVELLFATEAVKNQPYKAKINLFIISRAIDFTKESANALVNAAANICKATLRQEKYEFQSVDYKEISAAVASVNDTDIRALIKDEKAENLENQLIPYCYSFDRFPVGSSDISKIINALIEYPNAALSIQLMPTYFSNEEMAEIDRNVQLLETLSRGVNDMNVGNLSFALAGKHSELYKYYSDNKNAPLFNYNVLVYGDNMAAAGISTRVFGQLATGVGQSANLKLVPLMKTEVNKNSNFFPLPWAVNELMLNKGRNQNIWYSGQFSGALYRLPRIITAAEASEVFRLPLGSSNVYAGFNVNEATKQSRSYNDNLINAGDITVGKLKSSSKGDTIGFSVKDLAKHMLIVGTPGSGKTTFSVSLLDRLWKDHKIPFLVIEPAKNEYRAMVQSIPDLQVFTPGKNFISPFVFNPFVPPKNVRLETYKSTLKTAFAAGVSMSTPLDKIFEETINNCYSDHRWLDTYTVDDKGKIFNISDFIKCFQETFDEIGYTGDAKNIGRAGVVRLNSLVNLFDNYFSIPIEDILKKPTVIELAAIENGDQKALLIALILLSILAYVNSNYVGEGGLKNVILLEEAHVLLDRNSSSQNEANPAAIAQELVKRMLAEIRSLGVGLIIADQSPRKVTTDVVALTDMKMTFRIVEAQDKTIIADSTNMTENQKQRLSRLKPGEAFLFFNKLEEPEEVVTPDYRLENNISISLSDDGIKSLSKYWNDKAKNLRPYPQCDLVPCCKETCDYFRRNLAKEIARRIFIKNFKAEDKTAEPVKKVLEKISVLIKNELNDEPFTPELKSCVKVQLFRRIKYSTKIQLTDSQIENSLKK